MTKNINNNEIETLEGVYEETMNNNNQYYEQPKKAKRNFLKPLIIGALAVVVTGGAGAYAYDKYETAQRTKIQEAYSNIKMNVGNQSNQNNNNSNNGDNGSNSNKQKYEDDYAPQNNGVSLYVYKVEARANGLEYDVVVDAVSGKVLKVEIDN